MKFYDRERELEILRKNWEQSERQSMFTVVVGRRRVGKTSLLLRSVEGTKYLYLFVSKDSEPVLCQKFQAAAQRELGIRFFGQVQRFADLFEQLMVYGETQHYTLILDEFQNLLGVNKAIPGHIQDLWDRYRERTKVNLVVCGSIYSMMKKIFEEEDEPLYGRRDSRLMLRPFTTGVLRQILSDHSPSFAPDDLLCLYMLTGGVPKYVSLLMEARAFTRKRMIAYATAQDSPFLTEGTELIVSEFGKEYGTYFSILQLIASGMTTQSQIDSIIGKNTGTYLANLVRDYSFITKRLPLFAKEGTRNIKWSLDDNFLLFWFRFIVSNQAVVEMGKHELLNEIVEREYEVFSGVILERYFRDKFREEERVTEVGNYWDKKGENEIDVIALYGLDRRAVVAEVKRKASKYSESLLRQKFGQIASHLQNYAVEFRGLSLEDM